MTPRQEKIARLALQYGSGPRTRTRVETVDVPVETSSAPIEYDHTWVPTVFDPDFPLPSPKTALTVRMRILKNMKPGDSFALPAHLVAIWRKTGTRLINIDPKCKNWEFTTRHTDELNARFWRVA